MEEVVRAPIIQREVDQPTVVIQEQFAAQAPVATAERVVTQTSTTGPVYMEERNVKKKSFGQKMKEKLTGHP